MVLIPKDLKSEISLRTDKIRKQMQDAGVNAILISSNSNIYYSTCRFFRGFVYIPLQEDPIWFVIKPETFEKEDDVEFIRKPENIPDILKERGYTVPTVMGLEFDTATYSEILRLQRLFPASKIVNASGILRNSRMVKTHYEIEKMKEDGIHQSEAYKKIRKCYRSDMTDLEFQIEIERILRLEGCLGVIRTAGNLMEINLGSVIAGDNADEPGPYDFTMGGAGVDSSNPVGAVGKIIKHGETIMIDMNGSFNGYQTDMTRVWRLGEIPESAYKAHDCSMKILRTLEQFALPQVPVAELYNKALEIVREYDLEMYFMGHRSQVSFIGHGVGIELNEPPVIMAKSKDVLEENMTLAIEPKFVIPHVGAVGVENTYVVKKEGLENITIYPEEIEEL